MTEVDVGGDLRADLADPDVGRQQLLHLVAQVFLDALPVLELAGSERLGAQRIAGREHAAVLVHDGHVRLHEVWHGRRDELRDGRSLLRVQHPAAVGFQHDRRRRALPVANERGLVRHREVYASLAHGAQVADRSRELRLEVLVQHAALDLGAATEGALVHARESAVGQDALRAELHARLEQPSLVDEHTAIDRVDLVFDIRGPERAGHFGGLGTVAAVVDRDEARRL